MTTLAMFSWPGMMEWTVIVVIGLLLFGRRLPEVGRSLGRTIVEFKKGIRGIEDDVDTAAQSRPSTHSSTASSSDPSAADKK